MIWTRTRSKQKYEVIVYYTNGTVVNKVMTRNECTLEWLQERVNAAAAAASSTITCIPLEQKRVAIINEAGIRLGMLPNLVFQNKYHDQLGCNDIVGPVVVIPQRLLRYVFVR